MIFGKLLSGQKIFLLNSADQISMITYNFQDQNGNNIVRDFSTGEDFTMFASCQ